MNKVDPKQFLQVEQASIRVPSEQLKKCFRSIQRNIETEKRYFLFAGSELNKANNGKTPKNQLIEMLTKVNNKLSQIDTSLDKMKDEQVHLFSSLKERVNHLKQLDNTPSLDSDEFAKWSRVRLDRLIVDYLLRKGYSTTAQAMVEQERHLEPLVDQDLFKQCRNIEEALAQKDCGPCLAWCTENKTGLKKLQSNLEFNLRIQELVELIRGRKSAEAISYSKRHLIPNFMNKFQEIQQAISLLAFPPDTTCPPYKQLYDLDRWQGLVKEFRDNLYNLHCLTLIPMLELSLYSGLCSLKCTQCFLDRSKNTDCPICDRETFGTLAKPLPYIQHNTSTLVCRISGKVMDDNNPPMALPNGFVYSQKAILDHIQHSSNGKFKCPRSNGEFELSQIRKVFIS